MANPLKPTAKVKAEMANASLDVLPTTNRNNASIPKPFRVKKKDR